MEIKGYKFITGKTCPRPWGIEYRFSVISDDTGKHYDDIVMIDKNDNEEKIESIITNKLLSLSSVVSVEPEKMYSDSEINMILKDKKYFLGNEKFPDDLVTKPTTKEITNGK